MIPMDATFQRIIMAIMSTHMPTRYQYAICIHAGINTHTHTHTHTHDSKAPFEGICRRWWTGGRRDPVTDASATNQITHTLEVRTNDMIKCKVRANEIIDCNVRANEIIDCKVLFPCGVRQTWYFLTCNHNVHPTRVIERGWKLELIKRISRNQSKQNA